MPDGPLADLTVLDLSQAIAGPSAGGLLADFGAEVISIEPPGGGSEREFAKGSTLPNFSRNKRSIVLDLKSDDGRDVLYKMVEEADVLIHNNRPGKMERLRCDYETLSSINPTLVYCSITGYGESGPYKDRPGFDPLAQAVSGMMWMTGEPDRKPSRVGASTIDIGTGLYAAFAIWPALRHAERTGEGQMVEASLIDTAAAFMGQWYTYFDMVGRVPHRQGHSWEAYAPSGVIETNTGPVYVATAFQHLWERLCESIGREDWKDDPRFRTNDDRLENAEELYSEMDEEFSRYDRDDIVDRLLDAGVPIAEVQNVPEATEDEHLNDRRTLRKIENVDGEEVLASGVPVRLSRTPGSIECGPPRAGEHTREVLDELGYDDADIARLLDDGTVEEG